MPEPFVLGVNYWPRCKAMYWWTSFDPGEVREEFALIRELGLDLVRIFRVTHIRDSDRGLASGLQRKGIDTLHVAELAIRVDVVVIRADLRVPGRENQIRVIHGPNNIHRA